MFVVSYDFNVVHVRDAAVLRHRGRVNAVMGVMPLFDRAHTVLIRNLPKCGFSQADPLFAPMEIKEGRRC